MPTPGRRVCAGCTELDLPSPPLRNAPKSQLHPGSLYMPPLPPAPNKLHPGIHVSPGPASPRASCLCPIWLLACSTLEPAASWQGACTPAPMPPASWLQPCSPGSLRPPRHSLLCVEAPQHHTQSQRLLLSHGPLSLTLAPALAQPDSTCSLAMGPHSRAGTDPHPGGRDGNTQAWLL